MLTIQGKRFDCCDGVSRRGFVTAGTLGLGALTLPDLLAYRAAAADAGKPLAKTSVIFVELAGGPTHFETYDPKPDAPQEYRGPLGVVATNQSGTYLSELMVEQARIFDKLAVIRSIHHDSSSHGTSAHLTQTGYYLRNRQNRDNDMPCIGSVTSRVRGANHQGVPAYVALQRTMRFGNAAYLGKGFNPFNVTADPSRDNFKVNNLGLSGSLTADRLDDRRSLLGKIDRKRELADAKGVSESIDKFTRDAFDLVTGGGAQKAFDINAEPTAIRDRYGRNRTGQEFLLARRLIEAGVTFVSVRVGSWDDHGKIADRMKSKGPSYDQALAALVTDLHERGIDRDVMVVAMGEFGRTPKVNKGAGRDHWGQVMSVEPEELAYLFLVIAVGLGFGADQRWISLLAFGLIAATILLKRRFERTGEVRHLHLTVASTEPDGLGLSAIVGVLEKHTSDLALTRFDEGPDFVEASFRLDLPGYEQLEAATSELRRLNDAVKTTFLDFEDLGS